MVHMQLRALHHETDTRCYRPPPSTVPGQTKTLPGPSNVCQVTVAVSDAKATSLVSMMRSFGASTGRLPPHPKP